MKFAALVAALAITTISWTVLRGQQEMLPRPGPGSGITRVIGDVTVSNTPAVTISNTPDVRVIEMPDAIIASPAFIHKSGRYSITWAQGGTEEVTILDPGDDGWVLVENARRRWVNLRVARAVEEIR